jgi:CspA family cold shock protein
MIILFFLIEYLLLTYFKFHYIKIIMSTGTVKFYNEAKGFGFIVDDKSQSEVFVHASGLVDQVNQNDKVTYEITDGKKGPNAVNVKLA